MNDCKGNPGHVRRTAVAGPQGFYPVDPDALKGMILQFFEQAELKTDEDPFGLIAPHAGYIYSGPVAGWAYRQVQGRHYSSVIVLAPSHMVSFPFASVMPNGSYVTPLGEIPVDERLCERLAHAGGEHVRVSFEGHTAEGYGRAEHSLEVQLPFLQVALGDFKLVPVVIGVVDWRISRALGHALAQISADDVLIVASSDLSHYHGYDEAYRLDGEVIGYIEEMNAQGLAEGCRRRELEACGGMPISALLAAAGEVENCRVEILRHKTSGDVPGGLRDQVVGYLAAAIYRSAKHEQSEDRTETRRRLQAGSGLTISRAEKGYLLALAKQSVYEAVLNKPYPIEKPDHPLPVLEERHGLFVTLKIDGRLRGCIGNIAPTEPLGVLIKKVAVQTAFDDPRFPPLSAPELKQVSFEISVLGEMTLMKKPDELTVGRHGVMIRKGYNQGLLLPQVAVEMGWDRTSFLEGVCRKAGLPPESWRGKDAQIYLFSADYFGEAEIA